MILIILLLSATGFVCGANSCVRRNGAESYVCVCNATYCDDFRRVEQFDSSILYVYTSGLDAGRLDLSEVPMTDSTSNNDSAWQVSVDCGKNRQEVFGFGGAMTDAATYQFNSLSIGSRRKLLELYFSPQQLHYTFIRVPIAGTDFSVRAYSYDDFPNDTHLEYFQLASEDLDKIPLIHAAAKVAGVPMKLFGSAWAAPAWMKNDSKILSGGSIIPSAYEAWAHYYVKFFRAYEGEGLDFWGVSNGNEPALALISTSWSANQMKLFISRYLGPLLRENFPTIKLMLFDDYPEGIEEYLRILVDKNSSQYVSGVAFHPYAGSENISPNYLEYVHNSFPDFFLLSTEYCEGVQEQEPVTLGSWTRAEHYAVRMIEGFRHWMVGFVDWNMALDPSGGPTFISNNVDAAVIVNRTADEWYKQPVLYIMAHFSAFIPPGSTVLETNVQPDDVLGVAAVTPDKRIVVVILNRQNTSVTCALTITDAGDSKSAVVTLPARSIITTLYGTE